jgi:hypothetical protein
MKNRNPLDLEEDKSDIMTFDKTVKVKQEELKSGHKTV